MFEEAEEANVLGLIMRYDEDATARVASCSLRGNMSDGGWLSYDWEIGASCVGVLRVQERVSIVVEC